MEAYRICKAICKLSQPNNGYTKELNIVSWNNRESIYDIRTWNADYTKYGDGVTLTVKQFIELKRLLDDTSISDISSMTIGVAADET